MEPGERFGRLTVVKDLGRWHVECKCDCGAMKITNRKTLRNGDTKSCGCFHIDRIKEMFIKHGDTKTRLYRIWKTMRTRATNPNRTQAKDYVLRGITVCSEWSDYMVFREWALKNGYADSLTLDRINNDGPYSPDNCRWITYKEQCRNKRNTHVINYNGKEYRTIKDLCIGLGLSYRLVQRRLRVGWSVEDAIELGICKSGPYKIGQGRRERER